MKRKIHRAFVEIGFDRKSRRDDGEWAMVVCHVTGAIEFASTDGRTDEEAIARGLGYLNGADGWGSGCKDDAEHVL